MLILILITLTAIGALSIDMYLPSLPVIAEDLQSSAQEVQLTLGAFLIGFAIGQLFYGPLSDRFGRRIFLLWGLAIYSLAGIVCALSGAIEQLVALRFLQALGGCAGPVISRAIVRDLYGVNDSARIFSYLMMAMTAIPMVAPFAGGYVLLWFGWRAIFVVLAAVGVLGLLAVWWRVEETLPPSRRQEGSLLATFLGFGRILSSRPVLGYVLSGAAAFAGMFAYIAGSPFVFIQNFGVSPQAYGYIFGLNAAGIMVMAFVNGRIVHRFGSRRMLRVGTTIALLAGVVLASLAAVGRGGVIGIAVPLFVYVSMIGLIAANAVAGALAYFPAITGSASALFGVFQFGFGAVATASVGSLHRDATLSMAMVIALAGAVAFATQLFLIGGQDPGLSEPRSDASGKPS